VRALAAQALAETRMTMRRGESLLLNLGIPLGLLAFLALTKVFPKPSDQLAFLVPGILALAIMSTGMVSLGISTGFEREYQVLKRLGVTPLGRPRLVVAKVLSVVAIELLQVVLIVALGLALGWRPWAQAPGAGGVSVAVIGGAVAGTAAFAGLGLLLAGTMRADVVLALANALWLVLLFLGGMVFSLAKLPGPLRSAADLLPGDALTEVMRGTLAAAPGVPLHAWVVLVVWAVAAPSLAAWAFRWE
jgi:ABC-2 type transport system permease protein